MAGCPSKPRQAVHAVEDEYQTAKRALLVFISIGEQDERQKES
jgi:hypothetical protein